MLHYESNFMCMSYFNLLFFFQAEDGIRDHCVTGVQTCALPISGGEGARGPEDLLRKFRVTGRHVDGLALGDRPWATHAGVVRPEGRADRAAEPVKRDIGEQVVAADRVLDHPAAVAPAAELLGDP